MSPMTTPDDTTDTTGPQDAPDLEPVLDPEESIDASAEVLDAGAEHHEVVNETTEHDLGDDGADDAIDLDTDDLNEGDAAPAAKPVKKGPAPKEPGTKTLPPKAKAKAKAKGTAASSRVTAPADPATRPAAGSGQQFRPPSPIWVPIAMFGLWGFGLLIIILNYMDVLPGTGDGGNGWYLIAGLVAILGGIVAATKYH